MNEAAERRAHAERVLALLDAEHADPVTRAGNAWQNAQDNLPERVAHYRESV